MFLSFLLLQHFPLLVKLFSNAKECCVFHKCRWTRTDPLLSSRGERRKHGSRSHSSTITSSSACFNSTSQPLLRGVRSRIKVPPLTSKRLRLIQAQRLEHFCSSEETTSKTAGLNFPSTPTGDQLQTEHPMNHESDAASCICI